MYVLFTLGTFMFSHHCPIPLTMEDHECLFHILVTLTQPLTETLCDPHMNVFMILKMKVAEMLYALIKIM